MIARHLVRRAAGVLLAATACAVASATFSVAALAAEVPRTAPEAVGFSAERLARIDAMLQDYVDSGRLAGIQVRIDRGGQEAHRFRSGTMGADDDRALPEDAIWRIYSMTKPITSVAALMLYEEGVFQLTDPITRFLPEFEGAQVYTEDGTVDAASIPTIAQLLTHTAGVGYVFTPHPVDQMIRRANVFASPDMDSFVAKMAGIPLVDHPGEQWRYSLASALLGALVERAAGVPLEQFFAERIFEPLDMRDTFFRVPENKRDRLVRNHVWSAEHGVLVPIDEGPLHVSADGMGFPAGGEGLFSTIRDYQRFAEMLRGGGELDGVRLLGRKTVEFMASDHLVVPAGGSGEAPTVQLGNLYPGGFGFGLGFGIITSPQQLGVLASEGEFSWGGAAGTIFWIDPVEDIAVVGMIQLMGSPWPFRNQLRSMTNAALVD